MLAKTAIQLIVITSIFIVSQFGMLYIFPILPDITHDFFPELSESELGYRQGYLAGIYFLGTFSGSWIWGRLSDWIGRKRAVMLTTFMYSITIGLFGLSTSYTMALILRFLWGLFNGTDAIVKTFIAEVCENRQDLARGMSLLGLSDGLGRMIGPTLSAWLSRPATKFKFLDRSFLRRFPYFLPSAVCVCLGVVAIIISSVFLKESIKKGDRDTKYSPLEMREEGSDETDEFLTRKDFKTSNNNSHKYLKNTLKLFSHRVILSAIFNYNYYAFVMIQFDELIPLMLVTPPRNGGFCMNEDSLGFITFCTSLIQIPFALLIGPLIIGYLGIRKCLRIFLIPTAILIFLLPLWSRVSLVKQAFSTYVPVSTAVNGSMHTNSQMSCHGVSLDIADIPLRIWVIFFSLQLPISILRVLLFACYAMGVANSSKRKQRATVNGIAQSGASLVRFFGPIFGANVYAWSISSGFKWPMDASFIWTIASINIILLIFTSLLYPSKIEQPED
ncbi:hypothetical protein LOD99_2787 [Oopsacas minuta]|uniref:Major facilitator superfamily (MFS) profile domain-containing protein n=1 Tax=Oopsacas minuta TaxID=111878 RepID=A0AAV7K1T8_9METZ|nr:hypothetical protein LOD99_2787 [Oopsacas minuta]